MLGKRVGTLLERYADSTIFFLPEAALAEAEEHFHALIVKRGGAPRTAAITLEQAASLCQLIGTESFENRGLEGGNECGTPLFHFALARNRIQQVARNE